MPPTSSVSTARGRQPLVNVTSSTASTRAKVSASTTKGSSRSASGTLKAGQRTTVPKAPGKNLKSTGTRSDTMLSSTEATPAPNAHISDPTSMPVPKESTDAPKKPTPKTESTDLPKEATDLSSSMTNPKPVRFAFQRELIHENHPLVVWSSTAQTSEYRQAQAHCPRTDL
ncbi:hypothetical protein H2248_006807 [Termitomyces sp. 'cryptogamus']|nr:hypothetical protein H2248_006807 [Termitomyces sp. 'cryptogamus']